MFAGSSCVVRPPAPVDPLPLPDNPVPAMVAGGGTTCEDKVPAAERVLDPPPAYEGGGGTGWERMSPLCVLPQLLRSRLTCEGGGATTAAVGRDNLDADEESRAGAETEGATTFTVCESGTRELARSRGVSCGAGATAEVASILVARILSRVTSGTGAINVGFMTGVVRVLTCETSGVGGMTLEFRLVGLRLPDRKSGDGGTGLVAGKTGAGN